MRNHVRNGFAMARGALAPLLLATAAASALAQATPAGLWRTVDDETKRETSLVRIVDNAGVLTGRIEKLTNPSAQNAVCDKCSDDRKGKPIVGLNIIDGAKKNPDEAYWDSGNILDPGNGKTYKLRLTPKENGRLLEVRGYIGPFYRNQQWIRAE